MPPKQTECATAFHQPQFSDIGILLVGHGTRDADGQAQFLQLFKYFADCVAPVAAEPAFLELASPSIADAIGRMVARNSVRRLLVVPALLFSAGHALNDIPEAVRQATDQHGLALLGQTDTLGCSPEVLQLSAVRYQQAVCPAYCQNACCGEVCSSACWILVGRGSSHSEATEQMRNFSRLRQSITPVRQAITAFIYGQTPSVLEAMDRAMLSDAECIVVQPHLLFTGLLSEELAEQVRSRQTQDSSRRWVVTPTLGADQRLAEVLATLALSAMCREIAK